ncbi:MAG: hypothetical protein H7Z40_13190 [Phycisphaerae bacterium]|nr:hypothetical protein [Gemmatimonadaceae bacterium]
MKILQVLHPEKSLLAMAATLVAAFDGEVPRTLPGKARKFRCEAIAASETPNNISKRSPFAINGPPLFPRSPTLMSLWSSASPAVWQSNLDQYETVVGQQTVAKLADLDGWYRNELPDLIKARAVPHITHAELVRLTEWKMARGVWRAPNLVLVKGNDAQNVTTRSTEALAKIPHPTAPISTLAKLDGVGPATASAVAAAYAPHLYAFFDELVAAEVPTLGKVAWTLGYYAKYAASLRERAEALGAGWTPVMVERALWAHVGGKLGKDLK